MTKKRYGNYFTVPLTEIFFGRHKNTGAGKEMSNHSLSSAL